MSMILKSSPSNLFAGRTAAVARTSRSRNIVLAASGPKSKTARQTKKIEIDEDTGNTIGAAGIVGVAVATAGYLFVSSSSVVSEPAQTSVTEVAAPVPLARTTALPDADTGAKVKPSAKAEASAPVAKKETVKAEKPSVPEAPKYVAPPAIKAEKASSTSTFGAPKSAPAVKASSSSAAEPASSPSPAVIGGGVLVLAAAAAAAAGSNSSETSEGSSPATAAPVAASGAVPAGASSDAGVADRVKDRQMWIAAWKAKK